MNKQELINKVTANGAWCVDFNNGTDRYVKISKVKELIEKMDEPEKIIIPPFLDQYIQANLGTDVADVFIEEYPYQIEEYPYQRVGNLDNQVMKWLYDNKQEENDQRFLLAVQAFVTGDYEVEKEPLYQVVIDNKHLVRPFRNKPDARLVDYRELCVWEETAYKLTESEIKAIDERYWAFAVPVAADESQQQVG